MREFILFHREDCGYCDKARRALEELYQENPAYKELPLRWVEETQEPELADRYDYYAVPTFFLDGEKLFEAHIGMRYEDIREAVRACLDAALQAG